MLKDKLQSDQRDALKSGDKIRLGIIRLILNDIKNKQIQTGKELTDAEIVSVLQTMKKQRQASIELFLKGDRTDLVEIEEFEVKVLDHYLPAQLDEQELETLIKETLVRLNAQGPQDMGPVMASLKTTLAGKADMKRVSELLRQHLSSS